MMKKLLLLLWSMITKNLGRRSYLWKVNQLSLEEKEIKSKWNYKINYNKGIIKYWLECRCNKGWTVLRSRYREKVI